MEFAFAWFWSGGIPDCKVDHTHTLLLRVRPLTAGLVVCFRVNNNSKYIFQKCVSSDATLGFAPPHMCACFASVVLIKPKCCDLTALVLLIKSAAGIGKAFLYLFIWSTTRSRGPSINPRVKLLRRRSGQQMFDSCFQQLSLHTDFILNTGHLVLGMASVHRAFFRLLLLPAGCLPSPP